MTRTVGNARDGGVEARYCDTSDGREELDEIVAATADGALSVHLEMMSNNWCSLIIATRKERVCIGIGAARADVRVVEEWREPRNAASEGQRRRWNALTPEQRKRKRR